MEWSFTDFVRDFAFDGMDAPELNEEEVDQVRVVVTAGPGWSCRQVWRSLASDIRQRLGAPMTTDQRFRCWCNIQAAAAAAWPEEDIEKVRRSGWLQVATWT